MTDHQHAMLLLRQEVDRALGEPMRDEDVLAAALKRINAPRLEVINLRIANGVLEQTVQEMKDTFSSIEEGAAFWRQCR